MSYSLVINNSETETLWNAFRFGSSFCAMPRPKRALRIALPLIIFAIGTLALGSACGGSGMDGGMMGDGMMGGDMMDDGTGEGIMDGQGTGRGTMGPGMTGPGMMDGSGMMGSGMMGGPYNPNAEPITMEDAADAVRRYLAQYGGDLTVAEVMEFAWNFYAELEDEDTGVHAMELLIDKYTGQVYPEMGPNMMWNTKYGMMAGMMGDYYQGAQPSSDMPIGPERANSLAQQFLDAYMSGVTVVDADTFYGCYTLHTLMDGAVEGMVSVNGYSGQVWYHIWHGPFVQMKEFES